MSYRIFPFFVSMLVSGMSFTQVVPVIEWENSYGGSLWDNGSSVISTDDGGYIAAGYIGYYDGVSSGSTDDDVWVMKSDSSGSVQWQRTYGGSSSDLAQSIVRANDGGYIIVGYTSSNDGDIQSGNNGSIDLWVFKIDANGEIVWEKTYGGGGDEGAEKIIKSGEDSYLIVGSTSSDDGDVSHSNGGTDFWILKINNMGQIIWEKAMGGNNEESATSAVVSDDGGYVVVGSSQSSTGDVSSNQGMSDYWIVKLDENGNIIWNRSYGGSDYDYSFDIVRIGNSAYVVGGYSYSSNGDVDSNYGELDIWMLRLNADGDIEWSKNYGGSMDDVMAEMVVDNEGRCIVAGRSSSSGANVNGGNGGADVWIICVDLLGEVVWNQCYGGSVWDQANSILMVSKNEFVIVANSLSSNGDVGENNGATDIWMLKLNLNVNTISGVLFADLNSNGGLDADEPKVANHRLQLVDGTLPTWSNADGFYELNLFSTGSFEVEPSSVQHFVTTPATYFNTFTGFLETDSLNDFAFQPVGVINDLSVSIAPLTAFRPGFTGRYLIHYQNVGSTVLASNVGFQFVQPFTYLSASLEPTVITADSVSWQLPELQPFEEGTIEVTVNISATAVLGSTIIAAATIFPLEGDANIADNKALWWVTITGSYDPNDIQVDRPEISPEELADGVDLTYLIRFQNTGTDTAFTVRVDNPVPVNADFNTFDFIAASHPMQISYTAATSKLSFLFNNILLPDSNTNEPQSHGYILYRMKPRSNLVLGDSVLNQVGIYFDYNLPIITNVAHTVVEQPVGIPSAAAGSSLTVFPNPTTGEVMLRLPRPVSNGSVTVTDAMGRTVLRTTMNGSTHRVDLRAVPSGVYLIAVQDDEGGFLQRVVVE